jgi:hypothetical protein
MPNLGRKPCRVTRAFIGYRAADSRAQEIPVGHDVWAIPPTSETSEGVYLGQRGMDHV